MNGFKLSIPLLLILITPCCSRVAKNNEGSALFLIYKSTPQRYTQTLSIWNSPKDFVQQEQNHIPQSQQQLISLFDTNYIVLRIGRLRSPFIVDDILYENGGASLRINLLRSTNAINYNDYGYPIFIQQKKINSIDIYYNDTINYSTNLKISTNLKNIQ